MNRSTLRKLEREIGTTVTNPADPDRPLTPRFRAMLGLIYGSGKPAPPGTVKQALAIVDKAFPRRSTERT